MPQSGYTPQGDTAAGGNDFEAPKPEKPQKPTTPVPYTPPTTRTDDPESEVITQTYDDAAERNQQRIDRQTNRYLVKNTTMGPQERQQYLDTIDRRLNKVDRRLLMRDPNLAIELVMGDTKTRDLAGASSTAADGLAVQAINRVHFQEGQAQEQWEGEHQNEGTIPQLYASQGGLVNSDPVLREAWADAQNIKDPEQRAFLQGQIVQASMMPDGDGRDYATRGVGVIYDKMLDGDYVIPTGQDADGWDTLVSIPGKVIGAGQYLATETADLVQSGLDAIPGVSSDAARDLTLRDTIGGALELGVQGANFYSRNAQGAAVGITSLAQHAVHAALGMEDPEGGYLTTDEIWTTWDEASVTSGEFSPFAPIAARALGTTVDDPEYQTLFAGVSLVADLAGQNYAWRALVEFKLTRTATIAGGGVNSGEAFVNSSVLGGTRVVNAGWDLIEDVPVAQRGVLLTDTFKTGMPPTLANDLATATTKDEFARILANGLDDVPTVRIAETQTKIDAIDAEIRKPEPLTSARSAELDALQSERLYLEQQKLELAGRETIYEFPKIGRVRPFMRGVGLESRVGRTLNYLFGEGGKFDLSRFTNDLTPQDYHLVDPSALEKPRGWASHNFDVLRKTFNAAKVSKATQRIVLEAMVKVEKGTMSFIDWRRLIEDAYREGLGSRITAEADAAVRTSTATVEARLHSPLEETVTLPNGRTHTFLRNVLEDADGNPLPSRPGQVLQGEARLPDMRVLEDSTSLIRQLDVWAKKRFGKAYGAGRVPVDIAHFVFLELPRLVLKPLFIMRPSLLFKWEFDQGLRAFQAEGVSPRDWFRKAKLDTVDGVPIKVGLRELTERSADASPLGVMASEVLSDTSWVETKLDTRGGLDQLSNETAELAAEGAYNHIAELSVDPLTQRVATFGPEATLRYLESHPTSRLARTMARDIMPNVERAGTTLDQLLRDLSDEIDQATGFDPALREAVGTGQWRVGRDVETTYAHDRALVQDELVTARETLAMTDDPIMRRQMNLRIEELESRDAWLARHDQTGTTVPLVDSFAVRGQILNNWRERTYTMPGEVIVRRPTMKKPKLEGGSKLDRARDAAQRANQLIYRGFDPQGSLTKYLSVTNATKGMSRGSTYVKVYERVYKQLRELGYDVKTAEAEADARAVFITKDLHYDVSARSSFDRKAENLFWFAPVYREQLTTWLWKIPRKAFWAPGIALEFGMAGTFIQGLKDMGFASEETIYTDKKTGEETKALILHTPFGDINVSGMDPLSPGTDAGRPPTLAPGVEAVLDFGVTHLPDGPVRDFAEAITEFFSFDADVTHGVNVIPRSLSVIPEWFGFHIPTETFTNWVDYDRKIDHQVTQFAMSRLAEEGTLPPVRSDFPEGNVGDDQFAAATAVYRAQLDTERRSIEKGVFVVHLFGQVLLPGKVTTEGTAYNPYDNQAAVDYFAWKESLPDNLTSDAFFAQQNAYLAAHPEAFPYSVGNHRYSGSTEGDYWLTAGYRNSPTLDENVYIDKAIDQVQNWAGDDDPEKVPNDPVNNRADYDALSPRKQAKLAATWTTLPVGELTPTQADILGIPDTYGRTGLLLRIQEIEDEYDARYDYEMTDDEKADLLAWKNRKEARVASEYEGGEDVLAYAQASPGRRLTQAGLFTGPTAGSALARANSLERNVIADGYSTSGTAESTIKRKVDFYHWVDRQRQQDPAFDRQIRRIELGLGETDGPKGRVAAYEIIFFGNYDNDYGYQDLIEEAL